MEEEKRVFFGVEALAPWPQKLPQGRLLEEKDRHMTFAFLGQVPYSKLEKQLHSIPKPTFKVGLVGMFDQCLFLPPRHPNVVAWHIQWIDDKTPLEAYYQVLIDWLTKHHFPPFLHKDGFLPHVTLSRRPFDKEGWKKTFSPLPVILKDLHLYESLGHSKYQSCWRIPLKAPFDEIDHTADLAFLIRGETIVQIFNHAKISLAFHFPQFLSYSDESKTPQTLEEIIIELNEMVARSDGDIGCPFKAVSFHGDLKKESDQILNWEMIIDV